MMSALAARIRSARILAEPLGLNDVFHHMAVHIGQAEMCAGALCCYLSNNSQDSSLDTHSKKQGAYTHCKKTAP